MPDKDLGDGEGPSLELPSLFGRKRKTKGPAAAPAAPPEADTEADTEAETPVVEPAVHPVPAPDVQPTPRPVATTRDVTPDEPATTPDVTPAPAPPRRVKERRPVRVPSMSTAVASVVVGALVGVLGVLLTYLGLQGCEAVRGTESCGGPGLLVLVAIVAVMVVAGGAVLRMLRVPDGGNVSFLGVGILSVVVLMFLVDQLFEPWIVVAVPLLSAASFAVAHWVTTRFVEDL